MAGGIDRTTVGDREIPEEVLGRVLGPLLDVEKLRFTKSKRHFRKIYTHKGKERSK
jgi:hypothetical protein